MPRNFLTPVVPTSGADASNDDDGSCPTSPRRFYESEPLLVGALADRAQWWDYDASAYSDMESDGMQSEVEGSETDYFTPEGGRPQNDAFSAIDMLSRVWPRNQRANRAAAAAAQTSGTVLDEHVEGPELKDFAGGMEGDIMQAAAIATVSMDASDVEEVGYLEKLRQRVLAVSTVKEVTFAAGAARQPPRRAGVPKPDTRDSEGHTCPVHWFVADDSASNIRFFSLQVPSSLPCFTPFYICSCYCCWLLLFVFTISRILRRSHNKFGSTPQLRTVIARSKHKATSNSNPPQPDLMCNLCAGKRLLRIMACQPLFRSCHLRRPSTGSECAPRHV